MKLSEILENTEKKNVKIKALTEDKDFSELMIDETIWVKAKQFGDSSAFEMSFNELFLVNQQ